MSGQLTDADIDRFLSRVGKTSDPDACWDWQAGKLTRGYGQFRAAGRALLAHRVTFYIMYGRWPTPCALHTCDNPPCCNPWHIVEGTYTDNNRDTVRKGRGRPLWGELHPHAKLTEPQVREAKRRVRSGESCRSVAISIGISQSVMHRIMTGEKWPHVP